MSYMIAPGARLEIGPGGKPYETLGACCSACAQRPGLGDLKSSSLVVRSLVSSAQPAPTSSSMKGVAIIGLAIAAAGGFVLLTRRRKRR